MRQEDHAAARAILLAGMIPLAARLALLSRLPIPAPSIHDEFSYLLAADTFAHGRVTNPAHPLWRFFESFHILQQPTYMSMYPPMQGLILAFGKVFLGNPFWGACLSVAVLCALVCWVLRVWLTPGWALTGSLLVAARFGIPWANSYWGGTAGAIGSCLLLGAFLRLREPARKPARRALLGAGVALGAVILANSRPWEGMLVSLPVAVAFLRWIFRSPLYTLAERCRSVLLPCLLVLICSAAAMAYYNWRVTGSPTTLPYLLNRETYAVAPLFIWQKPRPVPVYRHEVMRRFYVDWEPAFLDADKTSSPAGWLTAKMRPIMLTLLATLLVSLVFRRMEDMRLLAVLLGVFCLGLGAQRYVQSQYGGPILPVVAAVWMLALQRVSGWRPGARSIARPISVMVLLAGFGWMLYGAMFRLGWEQHLFGERRQALERRLSQLPGGHLIIVSYSPTHYIHDEWVYNAADIDGARIVWARDMGPGANRQLLDYYRDRHVWCLAPDRSPSSLQACAAGPETSAR